MAKKNRLQKTSFFSPLFFVALFTLFFSCEKLQGDSSLPVPYQEDTRGMYEIVVNNRILATINSHPISVLDVVKKMDVLFYKQFPEYAYSPEARHEFYTVNWPYVLREMVDKQLILEDAAEIKMTVSHGDVRQEIEYIFGPDVMCNLDRAGLSFDEVFEILEGDIVLKRMVYLKVHNKALMKMTPERLKKAYSKYLEQNPQKVIYTYSFLTLRSPNEEALKTAVASVSHFLQEHPLMFSLEAIKEHIGLPEGVSLTVSQKMEQAEGEISFPFLKVLKTTQTGQSSSFHIEKNPKTSTWIGRTFFIEKKEMKDPLPLSSLEKKLKEEVLGDLTQKEMEEYLGKLTHHFDVKNALKKETMPDNFVPFSLVPRKK